ncbi:MAG: adenylosuccinate synthase [Oscillospiraceae bacterium]|jgi:adenylosuccinate synthase|nr:adenylosuccinate synthase [Oscillospiraceae bacterium]
MVTAIVGGNWGDEGKGKITDTLAQKANLVVRYQGGANAGHTIINGYGKHVLRLLPSGVFHAHTTNIIAQGVAFHAETFLKELSIFHNEGIPAPKIFISERAQIVMPYHILFDEFKEERLGARQFGSTKSGIAPFYADKALKTGIQLGELYENGLEEKIKDINSIKAAQAQAVYGKGIPGTEELLLYVGRLKEKLRPFVTDTTALIQAALAENKEILLEGQLGALRDIDNGIYPFVTSSSPLAGYACVGAGIPPHKIKRVVTAVKAYSSCVGAGAFVTELFGKEAETLRQNGGDSGEYGAVTGRARRVGWFDAVASRYGCALQGTTEVALTLLDVPGYLDSIPVCVAYEIDGVQTTAFPPPQKLARAKPVYTHLAGWQCDIRGINRFDQLPQKAKEYVRFIERQIGIPVTMISNGPKREDIIYR